MPHYVVAVDGQQHSKQNFESLTSLVQKNDEITVLSVFNPQKTESIPYDCRPAVVREYYETRCISRFSKDKWTFKQINKEEGYTTSKTILRYIQKMKDIDFLVVGFALAHHGADKEHLGSVTDMSLRESHMPVIINKSGAPHENNHFVIGCDGGALSHACIELAIKLASKPNVTGDRVTVIHIEDPSAQAGAKAHMDSDAVEAKYMEYAKTHPVMSFRRVVKSPTNGIADCIVAQAAELGATHILCGVDQLAKTAAGKPDGYVGSVTDKVVRDAHCSVIVLQQRQATLGKPVVTGAGGGGAGAVGASGAGGGGGGSK